MSIHTLAGLAARFMLMSEDMKLCESAIIEKACRIVEKKSKALIGTYNAEPEWRQLAESTQEERSAAGYAPNDPLLRTGDLRSSISHYTEREGGSTVGYVGTPLEIGAYQELGTGRIPPRPFLSTAAMESEHEIEAMIGKMVAAAIERRGSDFLELLHLAKEAAHAIKETIEEVVETPEDEKRKKR